MQLIAQVPRISDAVADNLCCRCVKGIIADCSPPAIVEDFQAALIGSGATSQANGALDRTCSKWEFFKDLFIMKGYLKRHAPNRHPSRTCC